MYIKRSGRSGVMVPRVPKAVRGDGRGAAPTSWGRRAGTVYSARPRPAAGLGRGSGTTGFDDLNQASEDTGQGRDGRRGAAPSSPLLEAHGVECTRGDRILFSNVSFALEAGALLRIAGRNGSGKTSLLRIVCGLAVPTAGAVCWRGQPVRRLRDEYWKDLVYVAHASAVKDDLTALENVAMGCRLAGMEVTERDAATALERFGIAHCAELPARALSQGQRRRVGLARLALAAGAAVWVLDEPFTALDTAAVAFLQELIGAQLARGGIVILTTHQEVAIAASVSLRIELSA